MKKSFKYLIIALAVSSLLLPLFNPAVSAQTQTPTRKVVPCPGFQGNCYADTGERVDITNTNTNSNTQMTGGGGEEECGTFDVVCGSASFISNILLRLTSYILWLVGVIFDYVLDYTVVNMALKLNDPASIGGSINAAWATLRDVANIAFIFVLLWAAFQTILELNTGNFSKTIKNIIIVALLINFSMFFTKVVIDASNIAATGFYQSIFQSAKAGGKLSVDLGGNNKVDVGDFSGVFMKALGMQSWYGSDALESADSASSVLVIGVMGTVTMLVLSIVLLVATVLFAARFILLIFIIILSPIAAIGYMIPAMQGRFSDWKDALINQSFFAPLFMLLMWVAIKLIYTPGFIKLNGQFGQVGSNPQGTVGLFINFVLVIGFIIGALILSKQMASKTKYFDAVAGGVGSVAIGGTAIAARQTIGRVSSRLAESKWLNDRAGRSLIARKTVGGLRTVGSSSFDARGVADTKLGKAAKLGNIMDGIGSVSEKAKGGFDASLKRSIEKKEKVAQSLKTDQAKRDYARSQVSGLGRIFARGGSRPNNKRSLFGSMGRGNRVIASRTLSSQIQPLEALLQTQRDNETNQLSTDTNLNQQLTTLQSELTSLQALVTAGTATAQNTARISQLNSPTGPIANLTNQITANNTRLANTRGQIAYLDHEVTTRRAEINTLGVDNPANRAPLTQQQLAQNAGDIAAGRAPRHATRPVRADEQNF
jgi:hypothetical protein